jgi:hypothetical protein
MRYILKDTGYIEAISFTHGIECNNKGCIEYTGSVPDGYDNLAEWSDNANINAYKIVDGNLTYDSEEDARLQELWANQGNVASEGITLLDVYPIGSIYMSINNTNPGLLFGGTWEQIAQGRTLVGIDTSDTDFNESEKTGGEKTHKLTVDEMPSHNHPIPYSGSATAGYKSVFRSGGSEPSGFSTNTGGNQPHNNLQPYLVVYMWKRIS